MNEVTVVNGRTMHRLTFEAIGLSNRLFHAWNMALKEQAGEYRELRLWSIYHKATRRLARRIQKLEQAQP